MRRSAAPNVTRKEAQAYSGQVVNRQRPSEGTGQERERRAIGNLWGPQGVTLGVTPGR